MKWNEMLLFQISKHTILSINLISILHFSLCIQYIDDVPKWYRQIHQS